MEQKNGGQTAKGMRLGKGAMPQGSRTPCIVVLFCSLAVGVMYLVHVLVGVAGIGAGPFEGTVVSAALVFLLASSSIALVFLMARMLADAFMTRSPFSHAQSRRLVGLGVLFFSCALLEAFVAIDLASSTHTVGIATLFGVLSRFGAPSIEILLIVAAFVSFYLSYIFRYGSFLQYFYDETV